jgi:hypothetical protein
MLSDLIESKYQKYCMNCGQKLNWKGDLNNVKSNKRRDE